jgi:hypothetical protein
MKISDIIIWIMFILSISVVFWYFFGNSPTLEEAILVLLLMLTITNVIQTRTNNYRLRTLERNFHSLARDFKEHIKHK